MNISEVVIEAVEISGDKGVIKAKVKKEYRFEVNERKDEYG